MKTGKSAAQTANDPAGAPARPGKSGRIALGPTSSWKGLQPQRHEHAVRVFNVVAKRAAEGEAKALVEGLGGLEGLHGTGL